VDFAGWNARHHWEIGSGGWLHEDYDGINYKTSIKTLLALHCSPVLTLGLKMMMRLGGKDMGIGTLGQGSASVIDSISFYLLLD
jgi:hypothetical protein